MLCYENLKMEEQPWLSPQVYFSTSNNKPHEDNATSSMEYEKFFVLYSWNKITDGLLDIHSIPVSFFLKKKKKKSPNVHVSSGIFPSVSR